MKEIKKAVKNFLTACEGIEKELHERGSLTSDKNSALYVIDTNLAIAMSGVRALSKHVTEDGGSPLSLLPELGICYQAINLARLWDYITDEQCKNFYFNEYHQAKKAIEGKYA